MFLEIWKSGELEFTKRPDGVVGQVDGLEAVVSNKGARPKLRKYFQIIRQIPLAELNPLIEACCLKHSKTI